MRNILNVIVDILTLLAIAVALVGLILPWFSPYPRFDHRRDWDKDNRPFVDDKQARIERQQKQLEEEEARRQRALALMEYQAWHAMRSGAALGALCVLVFLSLAISWGPVLRRFLVLSMFLCGLAAVAFIALSFSWFPVTEEHKVFAGNLREDTGFLVSLIPSCFALAFCLIRMIWTMPPQGVAPAAASLAGRHEDVPMRPGDINNPGLYRPRE